MDEFPTYQDSLPELGQGTGLRFDDDLIQEAVIGSGQMQVLKDGPRAQSDLAGIGW